MRGSGNGFEIYAELGAMDFAHGQALEMDRDWVLHLDVEQDEREERAAMARQDALDMGRAHGQATEQNDARDRCRRKRAARLLMLNAGFGDLINQNGSLR